MKFWDSSALVPLFVEEPDSRACRALLRADPAVWTWTLTPLEAWGACCRKRREGLLTDAEIDRVEAKLRAIVPRWNAIGDGPELRAHAARLVRAHDLRTADALQLAAALVWCEARPAGRMFVARDHRLVAAAGAEGFDVVRPG